VIRSTKPGQASRALHFGEDQIFWECKWTLANEVWPQGWKNTALIVPPLLGLIGRGSSNLRMALQTLSVPFLEIRVSLNFLSLGFHFRLLVWHDLQLFPPSDHVCIRSSSCFGWYSFQARDPYHWLVPLRAVGKRPPSGNSVQRRFALFFFLILSQPNTNAARCPKLVLGSAKQFIWMEGRLEAWDSGNRSDRSSKAMSTSTL
jgi:hypothetical protein